MSDEEPCLDRMTCVHLVTSTDADEFTYSLVWEVPTETMADAEAIERLAATLTEAYGPAVEWVNERGQPPVMLHKEET